MVVGSSLGKFYNLHSERCISANKKVTSKIDPFLTFNFWITLFFSIGFLITTASHSFIYVIEERKREANIFWFLTCSKTRVICKSDIDYYSGYNCRKTFLSIINLIKNNSGATLAVKRVMVQNIKFSVLETTSFFVFLFSLCQSAVFTFCIKYWMCQRVLILGNLLNGSRNL